MEGIHFLLSIIEMTARNQTITLQGAHQRTARDEQERLHQLIHQRSL